MQSGSRTMPGMPTSVDLELACRSSRSRFVTVNGLVLHFLEWGDPERPVLCFLHGGSAHAHWFDLVAGRFVDRFHVVSLDQRGHGESQWAFPPAYATENFVSDLVELMDAERWDRMTVVGHSMGGHNAMALASWHPDRVRALVVVDSRPTIPPDSLEMMHQRGRRPMRLHPSKDAATAAFRLRPRDTVADPALLRHLGEMAVTERETGWAYRFDPEANGARKPADAWTYVHRITAPTLLTRAELSRNLPRDQIERLRQLIPNTRVAEIAGAYHHVTLDRPREFASVLDDFLTSL